MISTIERRVLVTLLAACLAGCSPRSNEQPDQSATPPAAAVDTTVHVTGFGPVRAGMTVADAELALGDSLPMLGPQMEPCYYVRLERHPGVAFMVIDGYIARVDIQREATIATAEGARVGDPEERIRSLYPGRVEVQPHKYVDGHYLIVRPEAAADSNLRIIFETDGKVVTSYRAGRLPEVRWIEGCS